MGKDFDSYDELKDEFENEYYASYYGDELENY